MPTTTIGKNRRRFIAEIFKNGTNCQKYWYEETLHPDPHPLDPCKIETAEKELWEFPNSELTCDFETGMCRVRIHHNLHFNFTVDPAILKAGTPPRSAKTPTVDFDSLFVEAIVGAQEAYDAEMRFLEYQANDPMLHIHSRCGNWGDAKILRIGGGTRLGRHLKQWCERTQKCTMRVGKEWERWQKGVVLHLETPADPRKECYKPKKIAATAFVEKLRTTFPLSHVIID